MDAYATEEQQVEAIKKWFKQYGNMLSWIAIVILLAFSAYRYWFHHSEVVQNQASDHYASLLEAYDTHDQQTIKTKANLLIKDYPKTSYASFASFFLADEAVKAKDWAQAESQLNWIIKQADQVQLVTLAQLRLMKVFAAQDKFDEAIRVYDIRKSDAYLSLMAELKGDILMKKGDIDAAKKAYEYAYKSSPENGMHGPLLQMKMDELGLSVKNEAVAS